MKKLLLTIAILISTVAINAQNISVNINIGTQPAWGPTGYDYVDYYYMPDINAYYMVNTQQFVYLDGRRWITARYLPYSYRNYDLYGLYKVVLVGGARNPWVNNGYHYSHYSKYRNYRGQYVIRDSRDNRYRQSRQNHIAWQSNATSHNRPANMNRPNNSRPNNNATTRPSTNTRPSGNVTPRPSTRPSNSSTRPSTRDNSSVRSTDRSASSGSSSRSTSRTSSNSSNFRTVSNTSRR